jgi:hypothetical protein
MNLVVPEITDAKPEIQINDPAVMEIILGVGINVDGASKKNLFSGKV